MIPQDSERQDWSKDESWSHSETGDNYTENLQDFMNYYLEIIPKVL
jgi:hypothetical protein